MKRITISSQAADKLRKQVDDAPLLPIDTKEESEYKVKRVAFFPHSNHQLRPSPAFLETTDGKIYRLPDELGQWAVDTVAIALSFGNLFPCIVRFGITNGRYYADLV